MSLTRRFSGALLGLVFTAAFWYAYVAYLHPYFDYTGYALFPRDRAFITYTVLLAVGPALFHRPTRAVSSVLAYVIYLLLYLPAIVTFALASPRSTEEIAFVQGLFGVCMSALFLADLVVIAPPVAIRFRANLMPAVLVVTVAAALYFLVVYRGSLALVSFGQELYAQRAATADIGGDVVTRYLSSWLATLLAPLCLTYGLVTRQPRYFLAGLAACLVLYAARAAKIVALLPIIQTAFYLTFRNGRLRSFAPIFGTSMTVVLLAMVAIAGLGTIPFLASSIIVSRTIGNGGLLTLYYYDFFSFHRQTSYSHIGLVNAVTGGYPYGSEGLGQVVGRYYWSVDMNANANFWATDGLAALGPSGLFVATLALFLVFVVANSVSRRHDPLFTAMCFLPFVQYLLNASLFSAVWSGGAALLFVLFAVNAWPVLGPVPLNRAVAPA